MNSNYNGIQIFKSKCYTRRTVTLEANGVDLTQYIESGFDLGTPDFSVFAARHMAHGTCLALTVENLTDPSAYIYRALKLGF